MFYFDTTFIAPLLLAEAVSRKVETYVRGLPAGELCVSHWTRVEFASLLAREVRTGGLDGRAALEIAERFESLIEESFQVLAPVSGDYDLAREYLLHFPPGLRAGDAIHLAVAKNSGVRTLLTLDRGMLKAGHLLKLPVSAGIRI